MEDLGPILWIGVALLVGIWTSVTKKGRRMTEKAAKSPGDAKPHTEAWPSWDTPAPAGESDPGPTDVSSEGRYTVQEEATDDAPQGGSASPYRPHGKRPVRPVARIEEHREMTDNPFSGSEFTEMSDSMAAAPTSSLSAMDAGQNAIEAAEIGRDDASETTAGAHGKEFDLRKAVIYAEILKPKFDETE